MSTAIETNMPPVVDTNMPPMTSSNLSGMTPLVQTNQMGVLPQGNPEPVTPTPVASEYTVVKGDSLASIAKKYGVTVKALQAANPGVVPTKLKIGQKLVIPAGGKTAPEMGANPLTTDSTATYTVKSGDTLTKIAKAHGTTVKAIQTANNLTTTKIHVGQKLKIPSKAPAAPVTPAPAPVEPNTPPVAPMTTPQAPAAPPTQ
jgi:LysM repeat protein